MRVFILTQSIDVNDKKGECAERGAPGNVYFLCNVSAEKVNELQELLNKKDQEMKVMEDRYKKYLEKAKSVSFV